MVVNTSNRGGQALLKHFKVYTDDPQQPAVNLVISGKVGNYVEVSPNRVSLVGPLGQPLSTQVRIVPKKEFPFSIKDVKARTGQNIRLELEPSPEGYLLTVTAVKSDPGGFGDFIEIKTDLKEKPIIGIPVSGRLSGSATEKE